MSKRNSPEAKRAARERLRAERERQAKREKVRRQLFVGGAVVGVLAITGGIGFAVANMGGGNDGDGTDWGAVSSQLEDAKGDGDGGGDDEPTYPTDPPAHASGEDGLTVLVGDEDAEHTITLYEDPRCPACAQFEQSVGSEVKAGLEDGTYNVEFIFGTFLDDVAGGSGSRNALSALGAALNVSPEAFLDFHAALYSEEFHPAESADDFGDDSYLKEVAESVPELEGNAEFERALDDSTFAAWALQMSNKYETDPDAEGTPTVKVGDQVIDTPWTPQEFQAVVDGLGG